MTLDDVPADKIMTLTDELNRLFKAAGCKPQCHACGVEIEIGAEFQLLSFYGTDEMLCHKCKREELEERRREEERQEADKEHRRQEHTAWVTAEHARGNKGPRYGGGYSRPSRPSSQAVER